MSNKPQKLTSHGKVLTTNTGRLIARFMLIFATIGLVVGIGVMVVLNLGLPEKMFGTASVREESKVYAAASEPDYHPNLQVIDPSERGIVFEEKITTYTGEEQSITINSGANLDGLTVEYVNATHTKVGDYTAVAIISGDGYQTLVLEANFRILRAQYDPEDFKFESKLYEFNDGVSQGVYVESTLPEGSYKVKYMNNEMIGAGVYRATAVIYDDNHYPLTLEATLTIVNLMELVSFDGIDEERGAIIRTYANCEHTIELNTSRVLPEIVEQRNFTVTYDNNVYTDAGEYTITATVSADGFETFTVETKLFIDKGDINNVYGFNVDTSTVEYDGTIKNVVINHSDSFPEDIAALVTVKYFDANGSEVSNITHPGTYTAKVSVAETANCNEYSFEGEFIIDKRDISGLFEFEDDSDTYRIDRDTDEGEIKRLAMLVNTSAFYESMLGQDLVITYTYGDQVVVVTYTFTNNDVTVTYQDGGETVQETYYHGEIEIDVPIDFVDVGEYTVKAVVTGNEFDHDAELYATLTVKYASLSGVSVTKSQMVFANGNLQLPEKYKAGSGVTVEFLYNGEQTEGFKYFGIYDMELRFTKGNYQTTKDVQFIVMFNPVIALIGMIIGVLLGVLAGLLAMLVNASREKLSQSRFLAPSSAVANARGGIICESFAKAEKNGCSGRLYLSELALEFYSDDFESVKNNFLINLDEIRNVDVLSPSKIEVYANREAYVFTVPDGRAAEWAHHIVKA